MALYIFKDGQQLGPYEDDLVLRSMQNGSFRGEDLASRDGQGDWRPLSFFFPLPEQHPLSQPETNRPRPDTGPTRVMQTDPFAQYQPPSAAPPALYVNQTPALASSDAPDLQHGSLASASWGLGIASLCLMLVGLVPCLGWLNYFNFAVGLGAVITGAIVMSQSLNEKTISKAKLGLILAAVAMVVGFFRLILGAGCL